MPLKIPILDDRKYQDLLDEALARVPVHNPEWTNFNKSDPGVTLIEIFAFLTESLLYRANQIPERNRRKFLTLLGLPLQPASAARGLVMFTNDRGPLQTVTLNGDLEVRAGQVPFRTVQALDVLPVEARVFYKHEVLKRDPQVVAYYEQLYASEMRAGSTRIPAQPLLYETLPFSPRATGGIDVGGDTVDASLWVALLARPADARDMDAVREAIAGKTISLGVAPSLLTQGRRVGPGGPANAQGTPLLQYLIPKIPAGGGLPTAIADRVPQYLPLDAGATTDVLSEPGVVQITLPGDPRQLRLWNNLDPLEAGLRDFPPALEDTNLSDRVITWLRIKAIPGVQAPLLWVGINAADVTQRAHIANELLPTGTGEPDQVVVLAKTPVLPNSARLAVTVRGKTELWGEIDDLLSAGPEVPVPDLRLPPGVAPATNPLVKVFTVNPEAGEIRFGDGTHGARPPLGAILRAAYDYGMGPQGNVGPNTINTGPALPPGFNVTNPVRTWGGAAAETVREGEKQLSRYLQHRDRLVTTGDFETIVWRTPGVDIGRVDVLPTFNPELSLNEPGDAPGAVTVMVIPRYDPAHPDAPTPDRMFLDAICSYLDPRRLVTTEVFLRGPSYQGIWVSIGVNVVAGTSVAQVREAVKAAILQFLAPLPLNPSGPSDVGALLTTPSYADQQKGWPLRKPVVGRELMAVASRMPGVLLVNDVLLAQGSKDATPQVPLRGLQLPQVLGIAVTIGEPLSLAQLRGDGTAGTSTGQGQPPERDLSKFVPVPVVPEECK